uniref:KRAB domain-containing protein n=1 Tax=Molossus molossus TaxID=27622 RepID=A0A7J8I7T2_MOLMO|nr:hypothetical protein HJG59_010505 [Molossus molossus]
MLENDDHLVSAGHCITKPEAICKLEQEEGSWPLEGGFPGWSGPAQSMERASEQWRPRKDEQTQSPSLPTTRSRSVQDRGRGRDRNIDERECRLAISCTPPTGDQAHNLGMCPDR